MPYGYTGRILHVDLGNGRMNVEEPSELFYRTYLGGRNFIAYYLLREACERVDPLGPQNRLVFATGVLTGVPVGCTGRNSAGAKSPLTGAYGESEAGGFFGAELKFAGFDAIVLEGESANPVYLWIQDGEAEIRDASHLWGQDIAVVESILRRELKDPHIRIAQIGRAGENLVRYATIANDVTHVYGRCGLGAVMGSRKLKAIVARGHTKVPVADEETIRALGRRFATSWRKVAGDLYEFGTIGSLPVLDAIGGLPTRNFQAGSMPNAEEIGGERLRDTLLVDREGCYACGVKCKRVVEASAAVHGHEIDRRYGGPEYETAAALGSNCGIDDLVTISKANELCNRYGLDTISAGTTIAWVMECYERGILDSSALDGLDLRFGNGTAMLQLIEKIVHREGIGGLLGEGVARAAEHLGNGSDEFAMHTKGLELPLHEPRIKHGMGLGYAVSPTGADHVHNIHDDLYSTVDSPFFKRIQSLGILEPLEPTDLGPAKVRLYAYDVLWWSLFNCLELCSNGPYALDLSLVTELVEATTGWETSLWELTKIAERSVTLPQLFNVRAGLTPADDRLPSRFFQELDASASGVPLNREDFEAALNLYYGIRGWEPDTGQPTYAKMIELALDEFVPSAAFGRSYWL
jgi:aldehyde:ferredoxin oxidoreductase